MELWLIVALLGLGVAGLGVILFLATRPVDYPPLTLNVTEDDFPEFEDEEDGDWYVRATPTGYEYNPNWDDGNAGTLEEKTSEE